MIAAALSLVFGSWRPVALVLVMFGLNLVWWLWLAIKRSTQ